MTTALYTAGMLCTTEQRPVDIIGELCEAMAGQFAFVGNQLIVRAGEYQAPVLTFGDDDYAAPLNVQVRGPRENTFNVVTARMADAANDFKEIDMPRVAASAYITADGNVELPLALQYDAITNTTQAQQVSAVRMREARQGLTVSAKLKVNSRSFALELLDTVALNSTRYGWVNKPFLTVARKWSLDGSVDVVWRETDASVYAFGDVFDAVDAAPNTTIPLAHQVAQLGGLAATSGTAALSDGSIITRTRITWAPTTDNAVIQGGSVEVQYLDMLASVPMPANWPSIKEQGSAAETTIVGLLGGRVYLFRARFVNSLGVRGRWSNQISLRIAAPPSVGGTNLFVNSSFELVTGTLADNWIPYSSGTTGTITHGNGAAVFGDRAQRIECTALGTTDSDRAGYSQEVAMGGLPGNDVTFSVYASGAGGRIRLYFDWYNGATNIGNAHQSFDLGATVDRKVFTTTVPASATSGRAYIWLQEGTGGAAHMEIDAAQLQQGSIVTGYAATAEQAQDTADAALATATAAAASASAALAQLTSIASDSVLSPGEKPQAVLDYNVLISEQSGIDTQAVTFGITTERTAYDGAIGALTTYLGTLTGWNVIPGGDVAIIGTTWRSTWGAAYGTRQTLLNKIADEAGKRAAWANVSGAGKPADNASADIALVARGNCVVTGNSVAKVGGSNGWNSDCYSKNSFVGGCYCSAMLRTSGTLWGLNSDPATDQNYTSIDYGWYPNTSGAYIYESGSLVAGPFAAAAGDVFTIIYNGATVQYLQNNTVRRTVLAPPGLVLFFDSSLYYPDSSVIDQIRFGPITAAAATYRAISKGYNAYHSGNGPTPVGLTSSDTGAVLGTPTRSYLLMRIRLSDRVITYSQSFDVYAGGSAPADMAAALNATDYNYAVLVIGYDEPYNNRLSGGLADAMYRCGASRAVFGSPAFKARAAYILLGIGGCGEGRGLELYQGDVDNDPQAWVDCAFAISPAGQLQFMGSQSKPRTLADYSAGALAYLDTVDTGQLEPGAASNVQSAEPADNTWSWAASGGVVGIFPSTTIGTLSYTNSTGRSIDIEASGALVATGTGGGGTAACQRVASVVIVWNAGSSAKRRFIYLGSAEAQLVGLLTETISPGDTVTMTIDLTLEPVTPPGTYNAGSITYRDAHMRLTAILA